MRKVIYCLFMGLLILLSAPANQAATDENSSAGRFRSGLLDSFPAPDGRLDQPAISNPARTIPGMMAGAGLIGFVVMNAKRKK